MKRFTILALLSASVLVLLSLPSFFRKEPPVISANIFAPPASLDGFARATGTVPIIFPRDFGPHPEYQTEWWYYTGNLESSSGRHFGYQLTFFRRTLTPSGAIVERSSDWATNQVYMAHFALTDVAGEGFYAFERFSRGAAGLAGAQAEPYEVWLENWSVQQISTNRYRLGASNEAVGIELLLTDDKGPVLQGIEGYSQKGPELGNASYYYSQTRLTSEGWVRVGEERFEVHGLSWKDHEYSTSALSENQVGWDWFSIQLDNGSELMLYQLRREDGSIDPFSSGTLIAPDGSSQLLEVTDFDIVALDNWKSPHSEATYPMRWRLSIPSASLTLELTPYLEDQELRLSFTYWEGAVQVQGSQAGREVSGDGYVEMTGYAQSLSGQF